MMSKFYSLHNLSSKKGSDLSNPDAHNFPHVHINVERETDVLLLLADIVVDVDPAPARDEEGVGVGPDDGHGGALDGRDVDL